MLGIGFLTVTGYIQYTVYMYIQYIYTYIFLSICCANFYIYISVQFWPPLFYWHFPLFSFPHIQTSFFLPRATPLLQTKSQTSFLRWWWSYALCMCSLSLGDCLLSVVFEWKSLAISIHSCLVLNYVSNVEERVHCVCVFLKKCEAGILLSLCQVSKTVCFVLF